MGTVSSLADFQRDPNAIPGPCFRGAFYTYRRALAETTEASDNYHFLTFATVAGAIVGRRAHLSHGQPLFTNLYGCLVGDSGVPRKSTAIFHGKRLLADFQIETLTTCSWEGLLDALDGKESRRVLLMPGEYRSLALKARQEGSSNIIPGLTEAYDCPPFLKHRTRGKNLDAKDPFVAILSSSTREWLDESFREADTLGGFTNRWTFADGLPKQPQPFPKEPDATLWGEVRQALQDLDDRLNLHSGRCLDLTPEAREVFAAFYFETLLNPSGSELLKVLGQRLQNLALKLALLYALLEGKDEIHAPHVAAGVEFSRWERKAHARIFEAYGQDEQSKLEERVKRALGRNGYALIPLGELRRRLGGKTSAEKVNRAVLALQRVGEVDVVPGKRGAFVRLMEVQPVVNVEPDQESRGGRRVQH